MRRWTVQAAVAMPLSEASVEARRALFEGIAAEAGATNDGWGAAGDAPA
jgi:hypothetical protein